MTAAGPQVNYHLGRCIHDEAWARYDGPGGRNFQLLKRLYTAHNCGFMDGADWIFAEGIVERIKIDTERAGETVDIHLWTVALRGQRAGHVVVRVNTAGLSVYLDSDGLSTEQELLQRFQMAYLPRDVVLCPFDPDALRKAAFPRDPWLSHLVADLLLVRLGPIPASRLAVVPQAAQFLVESKDFHLPLSSAQIIHQLTCLHTLTWLAEQGSPESYAAYGRFARRVLASRAKAGLRSAVETDQFSRALEDEAGLRILAHTLSPPGLVEAEARSGTLAGAIRREITEHHPALRIVW